MWGVDGALGVPVALVVLVVLVVRSWWSPWSRRSWYGLESGGLGGLGGPAGLGGPSGLGGPGGPGGFDLVVWHPHTACSLESTKTA